MRQILLLVAIIFGIHISEAQVGINNTDPKAQLDIEAGTTPSEKDGLLIPRLDEYPTGVGLDQDGMMVFITGNGTPVKGFYYWDANAMPASWVLISGSDTDWTEVGPDIERQSGDVYIGDDNATNNKLIISGVLEDWDDINYIIDPNADSKVNEIEFNDGSATDPSIYFEGDNNTGFFQSEDNTVSFGSNDTEYLKFSPKGQIEFLNTGNSVFLGNQAGNNDDLSDNQNVGIGNLALLQNTTGNANVAVGYLAVRSNSTGASNVGVGYGALFDNTTGSGNNAIGRSALANNVDGIRNVAIGQQSLFNNLSGDENIAIGYQALNDNTANRNIGIGYTAGLFTTTGTNNIGIGYRAQATHTNGSDNIAIGDTSLDTMNSTTINSNNVAIGSSSMSNLTEAENNVAIGDLALFGSGNGGVNFASNNVAVGAGAGQSNEGNGNIFLGYEAGQSAGVSNNKLFIENSNGDANNALIYGEFDNDILRTNGELQIGNPTGTGYAFPAIDGSNGQVLTSNGNGSVTFQTISDDGDWAIVGANIERQAGDVYIGNTNNTNNDLYISDRLIDWDNVAFYLDPAGTSEINNVRFDASSAATPSIQINDNNTGFFSAAVGTSGYTANGIERIRFQNDGELSIGTTTPTTSTLTVITPTNGGREVRINDTTPANANVAITNNSQQGNGLDINLNSGYNIVNKSAMQAFNTLGDVTVDVARHEVGFTGYGIKSVFPNNGSSSTRYGVYSDSQGTNSFAGYFIGTTYVSEKVGIGIGATAPLGFIEVRANNSATEPNINLVDIGNLGSRINFNNTGTTNGNTWTLYGDTNNAATNSVFNIFHTGTGNIIRVEGDGKVGIMRNPTTNVLEVGGTASKATAGDWLANSDSRLKMNIETIDSKSALDRITSLRGVTYEWNDDKTGNKRPKGVQYGFIAQELMKVFPENVTMDNDGYYQTAYGSYDALYVQAFKEQQSQIEVLKSENEILKIQLSKYEALEARLSALENNNSNSGNDNNINISEEK